jgi:hypothetical protein
MPAALRANSQVVLPQSAFRPLVIGLPGLPVVLAAQAIATVISFHPSVKFPNLMRRPLV